MFWFVSIALVLAVLALLWWFGRHHLVTPDQLERQRRQLGMHDGRGNGIIDR